MRGDSVLAVVGSLRAAGECGQDTAVRVEEVAVSGTEKHAHGGGHLVVTGAR